MNDRWKLLGTVSHFIHHRFIWFLIASYAVAAVFPGFGLWIRSVSFGQVTIFHETTKLSLPLLMLSFLLLNAGLGVQTSQLRKLFRSPLPLISGLLANLFVPIAFIFIVSQTMRFWHNPDEVQNILVGLALVASMPIAGSSTAWSQNTNGDLALSLGLVLLSTFISPLTTPLTLHSIGLMATGDYAEDLHELATYGTAGFLLVSVLVPSVLGIAAHAGLGEKRINAVKPGLKFVNYLVLLALNYSNASSSLPQAVANPDWDFLFVVLAIAVSMCVIAFTVGWWLSRLLKTDLPQRTSLMFGLGMNNNGTGLVLATLALNDHPQVLLPIIFYNLVQHLVAGAAVVVLARSAANNAARPA